MKKIEAIIRPSKLEELKTALEAINVRGMTVYEVLGRGLQKDLKQYYRGKEHVVDLFQKVKVEIVCIDESVSEIISVIQKVCQTGKVGDGKIFILPVERVVRISSGEEGEEAL